MNKLQRLFYTLRNKYFAWLNPDPKPETIDTTGIVWSDYPEFGNGWIKGFLLNTPSRNIVITAKHCAPSTVGNNGVVFITRDGKRHSRLITAVINAGYELDGKSVEPEARFGKPARYYLGGDVAICQLAEPAPEGCAAFDICTSPTINGKRSVTFTQHRKPTTAVTLWQEKLAWVIGRKRKHDGKRHLLKAGDSGMPWFVWHAEKWQVVTVTSRGEWGEGCCLGHPFVYPELAGRVRTLDAEFQP